MVYTLWLSCSLNVVLIEYFVVSLCSSKIAENNVKLTMLTINFLLILNKDTWGVEKFRLQIPENPNKMPERAYYVIPPGVRLSVRPHSQESLIMWL
jgi:hypothetical protein